MAAAAAAHVVAVHGAGESHVAGGVEAIDELGAVVPQPRGHLEITGAGGPAVEPLTEAPGVCDRSTWPSAVPQQDLRPGATPDRSGPRTTANRR